MLRASASQTLRRVSRLRYESKHRALRVEFDDGAKFCLSAELLRVESPSVTVVGHGGSLTRRTVSGRRGVGLIGMEPVGNYAVRLMFDDMHSSGLYSWDVLYDLGDNKMARMRSYITALRREGKQRDPPRVQPRQ